MGKTKISFERRLEIPEVGFPIRVFDKTIPEAVLDALAKENPFNDGSGDHTMDGRARVVWSPDVESGLRERCPTYASLLETLTDATFSREWLAPLVADNVRVSRMLKNLGRAPPSSLSRMNRISSRIFPSKPYVYADISRAGPGYWREPHVDSPSRLGGGLLYLNDCDEGELVVYRKYASEWSPGGRLEETLRIRPRKGRLVLFAATNASYHAVSVIPEGGKSRPFVYFAPTKHGSDPWKRPSVRPMVSPANPQNVRIV